MKSIYSTLLLLISVSIFSQEYTGTYNLQFGNESFNAENELLCLTIQIAANDSTFFNIGTSSILFTYNTEALTYASYTPINFNGNIGCYDGVTFWQQQQWDATSVPGMFNLTLTFNGDNALVNCPIVGNTWVDIGEVCFYVNDFSQDQELVFSSEDTNFNNVYPNNGTNPIEQGTVEGFNNASIYCAFELEDLIVCENTAPILISGPDSMINYLWNTGSSRHTIEAYYSGNYALMITDEHNCTASDTMNLIINPSPEIELSDTTICENELPFELFIPAGYQSEWTDGTSDTLIQITNSSSTTFTVTNEYDCSTTELIEIIVQDASECFVSNSNLNSNIEFYLYSSNSSSSTINIVIPTTIQSIKNASIFNIAGQTVKVLELPNEHNLIDISALANGQYILNILTDKGRFYKQFIKY